MGSRDGSSTSTFHSKCNSYTKTIVVMKNNYNKVIGGTNIGTGASAYTGYSNTVGDSPYQMVFSLTANQAIRRSTTSYNSVNQCAGGSHGPNWGYTASCTGYGEFGLYYSGSMTYGN